MNKQFQHQLGVLLHGVEKQDCLHTFQGRGMKELTCGSPPAYVLGKLRKHRHQSFADGPYEAVNNGHLAQVQMSTQLADVAFCCTRA